MSWPERIFKLPCCKPPHHDRHAGSWEDRGVGGGPFLQHIGQECMLCHILLHAVNGPAGRGISAL
jgi:hypothetical protein